MKTTDSIMKKIAFSKATLKSLCNLHGIKPTDKVLGEFRNAYSKYSLINMESLKDVAGHQSTQFRDAHLGLIYAAMKEINEDRDELREFNADPVLVRNEKHVIRIAGGVLSEMHRSSNGKLLGGVPALKVAKRKDDPTTEVFSGRRVLYLGHHWVRNVEKQRISTPSSTLGDVFVTRATDRKVARLAEEGITAYNATAYIRQSRSVLEGWVFKFTGYEIEMCLFHEDFRRGESLLRKRMRKEIMNQFEED